MMVTPDRLAQIRERCNQYGPANCWTGTTGTLCGMLRELLDSNDQLARDNVQLRSELADLRQRYLGWHDSGLFGEGDGT